MRIGIDAASIPPAVAGAGRYIHGLVQGLAASESDHEFVIYCKARDAADFAALPANFRIHRLPNYRRAHRLLWQMLAQGRLLAHDGLDVWHATHYVMPLQSLPIPVVATIHDLAFFHFPQFYHPTKRHFFQWMIRRALRHAAVVVAVSQSTQRDVRVFAGEPAHCVHVPSGISDTFFQGNCPATPLEGRPFILAVATQEKRKNLPFLVRVFSRISSDFPDLDLVLVGQPENDTAAIRHEVARHGLSLRVHLTGYVANEHLVRYYAGARLVCQPSHYEGFGFPVLEALAAGTPVLVSARPAMTEIGGDVVTSLPCGDLVAWEEGLRTSLMPSAEAVAGGQRRRAHAARYTWRETGRRMLEVYEHVAPVRHRSSARKRRPPAPANLPQIEHAVLKTIAFADVFQYPLTLPEIHGGLLDCAASAQEVAAAAGALLRRRLLANDGSHYVLPGRQGLVARRDSRIRATQRLLQQHRRDLQRIARMPFIRAISISGAAAFGNCPDGDDLDLFIVTEPGRLWLVYTTLALMLKLRRKRHSLCLNYLIAEGASERLERNFYVAHQIAHLRPLLGEEVLQCYRNRYAWVAQHLPQGGMPAPYAITPLQPATNAGWLARLLRCSSVDGVETLLRRGYSRRIRRLARWASGTAVRVNAGQIKLFTNDHMDAVLAAFAEKMAELNERILLSRENVYEQEKTSC